MQIQPFVGTLSQRREVRQALRNVLGVSRSPAPTLRQIAGAITHLDRLVYLTTAGDYRVRLVRKNGEVLEHPWTELKAGA